MCWGSGLNFCRKKNHPAATNPADQKNQRVGSIYEGEGRGGLDLMKKPYFIDLQRGKEQLRILDSVQTDEKQDGFEKGNSSSKISKRVCPESSQEVVILQIPSYRRPSNIESCAERNHTPTPDLIQTHRRGGDKWRVGKVGEGRSPTTNLSIGKSIYVTRNFQRCTLEAYFFSGDLLLAGGSGSRRQG